MDVVYERCCGIDVHKRKVTCALRLGKKTTVKEFGTYTQDLRGMVAWLKNERCQIVAMESTGSYWKPLYNIFELEAVEAIVVNAQHMKAIPGHKTDINDAAWIADLLQHGLLKASFIPGREQRELRELTRYRKSRMEERAREINRLQKILEGANVKVGSALTNIMGDSAQRFLRLLISDKALTLEAVIQNRDPRLKSSADELFRSLCCIMTPLQKELLSEVMATIREQTVRIARMDAMIEKHLSVEFIAASEAIIALPGIGIVSAHQVLAEIGIDMSRFPTAHHLCSWAGLSPGNNESAGKRRSGKTNNGNPTLKTTLVQCAHSAMMKKDSFFYTQAQRIAIRRGRKRAAVAVAHSMLIAIWHVLSGKEFHDLGADYYNQFNRERKINLHLKQLKSLGWVPPAQTEAS